MGLFRSGRPRVILPFPVAIARGFSCDACGNPLRSRLKAVSPPTARGALSEERAITQTVPVGLLTPQRKQRKQQKANLTSTPPMTPVVMRPFCVPIVVAYR
jgi:hypothetical protein